MKINCLVENPPKTSWGMNGVMDCVYDRLCLNFSDGGFTFAGGNWEAKTLNGDENQSLIHPATQGA